MQAAMQHPNFDAEALPKVLTSAGGAFAVVFFFVTFSYLFKQEFVCPCDPEDNAWFCLLYMILPFIIFFGIIIVVDNTFLEILTDRNCCSYISVILKRLLRAVTVGLLWIVTALIDGDWWVCLQTTSPNITVRSEQPACKNEPTGDEYAAVRHWKSVSCVSGLALLCGVLVLWTFVLWCSKSAGHKIYNKALYNEYVLEETDNLLKVKLKDDVKEDAEDKAQIKLDQIKKDIGPRTSPRFFPAERQPLLH